MVRNIQNTHFHVLSQKFQIILQIFAQLTLQLPPQLIVHLNMLSYKLNWTKIYNIM